MFGIGRELLRLAEKYGLVLVFGGLWLYFWLISSAGDTFASSGQIKVVLLSNTVKICLALAFILPLLAGQFDLAVGHNLALTSVVAAKLVATWAWPVAGAVVAGVALATLMGVTVGVLVARFEVHSLIASLGLATILTGVLNRISEGRPILIPIDHALADMRKWPWPIVYAAVIAAVMWYVLEHTPFGRRLHAVGSNTSAARLSGIPVKRMIIYSFALSGFLAGLAGVLQMTRDGGGNPQSGPGLLLPVFAAAFLGATAIKRTFNVRGTVLGVLGIAFTVSGLILSGAKPYVEDWFNGGVLLIAVAFTAHMGKLRGTENVPVTDIGTGRWIVDNPPSERWPIYTRGNVGEVFPDVITPLGWSIVGAAAEAGWRDAYRVLGVCRSADFSNDFEILGIFNGYCYLNASLLRVSGVRAPGSSPEAVDQQLLGDSTAPPYEKRRGDNVISCRIRMLQMVRRMLRESGTPELALAARDLAEDHLSRRPSLDDTDDALINYITSMFSADIRTIFAYHINLTTKSSLAAGYLAWLCLRAGDLGLLVRLLTDLGGVESAGAGEAMWRISRLVRSNEVAGDAFAAGLEGLDARLRATPEVAEVVSSLDDFLVEYGHLGSNAWELASPTWGSSPAIALASIDRLRLTGDERAPEHQRRRAAETRASAEAEILENLSLVDRRSFRMVMEATGALSRGREMTRNQNIVVINAAREVLYELARRGRARGGAAPELAFMLEWEEFIRYIAGPAPFLRTIAERDELRGRLALAAPPFVIADDLMSLEEMLARAAKEHTIVPEGTELQGTAGCPGVARGRARVVLEPDEPGDLAKGDILVAPLTDPSWTPLFLAASGVVVAVGATVSHAVVISRELCIPCVVGVRDATVVIPDGALVEIDGSSGTVRVIEHPDAEAAETAELPAERTEIGDIVWIGHDLGLSREITVALLGGKGANLSEMAHTLELPVPPAFIITTDVCRSYLNGQWPDGLDARIEAAMGELGAQVGRSFGTAEMPLLVSVRSGAPVSMPGMMDTVLNVGINPTIRDALAAETGSRTFAAECWLRFCRMYAEIVLGVDRHVVEAAAGEPQGPQELNAAADRVRAAADGAGGIPLDPVQQLTGAVRAVLRSWRSPRAVLFRETEGIDEAQGTAVTVQAMVFGNLDERSGSGVIFTRDPATGRNQPYGDYLPGAQGEDVVAGTHEVRGLDALAGSEPAIYAQLLEICDRLERHYRHVCDIEFTVAGGELFILQARVGRTSPEARIRIAVQMAEDPEFPVTRAEAIARVDRATLDAVAALASVKPEATALADGIAASPGVGVGMLCCDPARAAELARAGARVVLARAETSPADVHALVGAAGVVTSLGGAVSHAAVVARSWAIPAVTGARGIRVIDSGIEIGDVHVGEGSLVTVDGSRGRLFDGNQLADHEHNVPELDRLRLWALDLGVELGQTPRAPSRAEAPRRPDVGGFDVLRAIQLKGLCSTGAAALALDTDVSAIGAVLARTPNLASRKPGGWTITAGGRAWLDEQLVHERESVDDAGMSTLYGRFVPLNQEFKMLVTDWQTTSRSDTALASVTARLERLHAAFAPLAAQVTALAPRLAPYPTRFDRAVRALRDGDGSMLASPLKDSYHTVWFEYHEELLHLIGRTRLEEEQDEST